MTKVARKFRRITDNDLFVCVACGRFPINKRICYAPIRVGRIVENRLFVDYSSVKHIIILVAVKGHFRQQIVPALNERFPPFYVFAFVFGFVYHCHRQKVKSKFILFAITKRLVCQTITLKRKFRCVGFIAKLIIQCFIINTVCQILNNIIVINGFVRDLFFFFARGKNTDCKNKNQNHSQCNN